MLNYKTGYYLYVPSRWGKKDRTVKTIFKKWFRTDKGLFKYVRKNINRGWYVKEEFLIEFINGVDRDIYKISEMKKDCLHLENAYLKV